MRLVRYKETWDLSTIPDDVWFRAHGQRLAGRRKGNTEQMRELARQRWAKSAEKKEEKVLDSCD